MMHPEEAGLKFDFRVNKFMQQHLWIFNPNSFIEQGLTMDVHTSTACMTAHFLSFELSYRFVLYKYYFKILFYFLLQV